MGDFAFWRATENYWTECDSQKFGVKSKFCCHRNNVFATDLQNRLHQEMTVVKEQSWHLLTLHSVEGRWWTWVWWVGIPRNPCASATLSITNHMRTGLGSNPGLCGNRPANNRLSHGTATNSFPPNTFLLYFTYSQWIHPTLVLRPTFLEKWA